MSLSLHALLLSALAALGVVTMPGTDTPATAAPGDVSCSIDVRRTGSGVTLRPMVSADRTVSGSYRLRVTSRGAGGGSDIDQSGEFTAVGARSVLGSVSLGGDGAYEARLTVTTGGRRIECAERIGGPI